MKFLFLYENKLFMSFLKELIINNKDECVELNDAADICSAYRKYMPDWILLDLGLKNNNGFKLAKTLKSEFPEVKIALLSDFNDERLEAKSKEIRAVFVPKEIIFEFYDLINISKSESTTKANL